jgi:hypothetical protein
MGDALMTTDSRRLEHQPLAKEPCDYVAGYCKRCAEDRALMIRTIQQAGIFLKVPVYAEDIEGIIEEVLRGGQQ